ncbi:MAG: NAD-dependent epimerase/dehydratase family protein [Candidatus Omnitrophota bacterium]
MLITGGAGFVGANLACYLKQDYPAWKIIVLDNLHRRGSELNVSRLKQAGVVFIHGDVRNMEDLACAGKIDLLLECSAEPSVLAGYGQDPGYLIQTNLGGTVNCLEKCRKDQADMIFLSTSRVYPIEIISKLKYLEDKTRLKLSTGKNIPGVSKHGFSEDFSLHGVRSLYGATKLCSELLIQEYISAYGIRGIINRCGVLTGPWQMGKVDQGVVALWVARHLWNKELNYIGYGGMGKQVRDILHIQDLYQLIRIQIKRLNSLSGNIFNVGGGIERSVSLCELTQLCQQIIGQKIKITSINKTRQGDIPYYVSDCRRVENITGWKQKKNLADIVSDVYLWLKENEKVLKPIFS